jgi:acyl-coenzyme A thioesterase PaaI-like protein
VVVTANPSDAFLNPGGTVHGGFAATLLDSCMGLAIWSTLEKGVGQTTLEFKISLVRRSRRRLGRSKPKASCSIAAAVSAPPKAALRIATAACSPTARRRV